MSLAPGNRVSAGEIELWILSRIAEFTGEPTGTIGPDTEFADIGLSSRDAVVLVGELQDFLARDLPHTLAWDYPNARALARHLAGPQYAERVEGRRGADAEDGTAAPTPIAVVGMACRFPGAPDVDAFWSLCDLGQDGLEADSGRRSRRPHGFLPGIDQFDAALFAISDLEAVHVDPQQRLVLEVAWEALEDAAIAPTGLEGSRTGVFIGISGSDYGRLQTTGTTRHSRFGNTGEALSIAANRLSYFLDLHGPSLAIDTACSSSLTAVHLAVRSLRAGESDLALAGGVNVLLAPQITETCAEAGMLAPDGRCKTFDAAADGYVRSEGCGLVVLKRLPDAVAGGDRILGVVGGSVVGQEGRTNGLTAPSGLAQQAMLRAALRDAQMEPADIAYVEAHGTGTALGDPIEVAALCAVLGEARDTDHPLLLGSVKANIGHAESASGIAGLIKVLLMLRHRRVPGQIHLRHFNPQLPGETQVRVPRTSHDWVAAPGRSLVAGVSSFGFGGSIAHAIVQEPPLSGAAGSAVPAGKATYARPCHLLTVSANSEAALAALAGRHAHWLREHPDADLGAVARTTTQGRAHLRYRAAVVARTHNDAVTGLESLTGTTAETEPPAGVHRHRPGRSATGCLAMVFGGQGAQYIQMGRQLYATNALFRGHLRHCQELLADSLDVPLLSVLFPLPERRELLDRMRYAQPAVVAVGYALAQLWRSWGVVPDFVLGHSLGEFTAACVAGVLDLADGLRLVAERGRLIEELCEPGSMAVVFASEELVRSVAAQMPGDQVPAVAAVNGPDSVVLSGRSEDLNGFLAKLSEQGVASRPLRISCASHSPMMRPAQEALAHAARGLALHDGAIGMVSDLDGRLFAGDYRPDAGYWARHLTHTVRFTEGVGLLAEQGCSEFLEVGPGRALTAAGQRVLPSATWVSSMRPGVGEWTQLTDAVAALYAGGRDIDWSGFHHGYGQDRLPLPGYPFERRRYWLPAAETLVTARAEPATGGKPDRSESVQKGVDPRMESFVADAGPRQGAQAGTEPVLAVLSRVLGRLLGQQQSAVDPDRPFLELGADSMTLFETLQAVQRTFHVTIPISSLFEQLNTLNRLSEHIVGTAPPDVLAALHAQTRQPERDGHAEASFTPAASGAAVAGSVAPGVTYAPPGPDGRPELEQFLQVHAQVMNQAYELLRSGGANGDRPRAPSQESGGRPIALAPRDTFVAFRADRSAEAGWITDSQRTFAQQLVQRYEARTRRSKELVGAERQRHSDMLHTPQPFPELKQIRYPVVADRALGARLWDVDGNEYIDLTMGFGVNLFGHQEPFIVSAVSEQLAQGIQLGPHSALAGKVARLICDMTSQQRVVFCNTGSEAVMVAVRLARAVTGRRRIALFAGAYHGAADPVLARQDIEQGSGTAAPLAPGITDDIGHNAIVLPYGEDVSLDVLRAHSDELAAVLVEPVQSRKPDLQPVQFLSKLRDLTRAAEIPLIFDEVITGFRSHPGGAQALFGIKADITTYGKVLGGGLPIGVVAGEARYLNAIDGGAWGFDDERYPGSVRTFFTGTFAKHPLSLAAARAVLTELKRRGPSLQEDLNSRTANLAKRLNSALDAAGAAVRVNHFGSLFRFQLINEPPRSRTVELFYTALVEKGLYIWDGRNCFLSTAHTDADLDEIVSAVARTATEMAAAGFFGPVPAAASNGNGAVAGIHAADAAASPSEWPLSRVQQELWLLSRLGLDQSRAYTQAVLLDLRGELDPDALRWAVAEVLTRHDSLRSVIAEDGSWQRLVPPRDELPLIDLTSTARGRRPRRLAAWLEARAREVLDLTERPPVRTALLRLEADHHQLYFAAHHAMIDGWSFDVVLTEVADLYDGRLTGKSVALPEPVQYREHVAWERQRQEGPAWEADVRYWQEQYADGIPELILPTDRPRSAATSLRLGAVEHEISRDVSDLLSGAASRLGVTSFVVLLAAYGCLLHQLSDQDDLMIGVPFARRSYPGGERVVGNCSTTIPVRSRLRPGAQAGEYIRALQATLVSAHEHSEFSIGALRERIRVGNGAGGRIFAVGFNMDHGSVLPQPRGLKTGVTPVPRRFAQSDMAFDILQAGSGLQLTAYYNADLFHQATVDRYTGMFEHLLRQFVAAPDAPIDWAGPTPTDQSKMKPTEVETALRVLPM